MPVFFFFFLSQLFGSYTISLSGENSFVCLKLSAGKKLWFTLSCFPAFLNEVFSRCQRKEDAKVQLVQQNLSLTSKFIH